MADTVKSSADLKIGFAFADGDTRTVTLPNPKAGLTEASIKAVTDDMVTNNLIIGDRAGAALTGAYTAYTQNKTTTDVDLA